MDLTNKVAIVTGGAHRVGKAIALALAREGTNTVVHYGWSEEAAHQTAAEIGEMGVEVLAHSADLSNPAAIDGLFEAARSRFGRLDVLVNSAASFEKQPFDEVTPEDWDRVMAVNLRAPFLCTQQAARLMGAGRGNPGVVINIADEAGVYAWKGYAQHGVSKAGLLHLTAISARELAPHVRANALVLGPILPPPGVDENSEGWKATEAQVPLGRSAHPDEVGRAVVSLAQNDFITGAVLDVTGGEHLLGPVGH